MTRAMMIIKLEDISKDLRKIIDSCRNRDRHLGPSTCCLVSIRKDVDDMLVCMDNLMRRESRKVVTSAGVVEIKTAYLGARE